MSDHWSERIALGILLVLTACTEIRSVQQNLATGERVGTGPVPPTEISLKLPHASRSVPLSSGYAALGCAGASLFNFCFTVLTSDGVRVREVGDLPKITLASGGYTVTSAIAFLPPNDVIIVGHTTGNLGEIQGGLGDGFVARYSLNGTRVWVKQFGQTTLGSANTNQREDFFDVAVDASGNIYIAGRSRSHFGLTNAGNYDALLLKLDGNGQLLWQKLNGSSNDEEYRKVVVNSQGQILAGGHTCGNLFEVNAGLTTEAGYNAALACPTANFKDVVVSAYSSSGTLVYNKQLGRVTLASGKGQGADVLFDLSTGSSGEVFITGSTTSSYGKNTDASLNSEAPAGLGDVFVSKLSSGGALQWTRVWGASFAGAGKVDVGKGVIPIGDTSQLLVCAETMGNLLESQGGGAVAGGDAVQGKGDLVLIRLSQTGTLLGQSQLGNVTLGSARTNNKETCGSLVKSGTQFVLFGTSDSTIFPSGSGSSFMVRANSSEFEAIR